MKLIDIYRFHSPLLEGINSLFDETIAEATEEPTWPQEWASEAMQSPKFQQWLKSMGVVGPIGKMKHGNVGRAYPVGDNSIIKFTTDAKEAQAAAILKGHDSKHAANIYGVHRISSQDFNGRRMSLYAIAMEKLNTGVGGRMRAAGNAVYQYLDDNSGFIEDVDATVRTTMDRYVDKKLRNDPGMMYSVKKVVQALYDVQERTGVLSQDPHGGNVAFKGRDPAFFDFGRSSVNYNHPKADGARITALPEVE